MDLFIYLFAYLFIFWRELGAYICGTYIRNHFCVSILMGLYTVGLYSERLIFGVLQYYLTRKTLKSNSLVQNICKFLQKETSHCSLTMDPSGNRSIIFLTTRFIRKITESSDIKYPSIYNFTFFGSNS